METLRKPNYSRAKCEQISPARREEQGHDGHAFEINEGSLNFGKCLFCSKHVSELTWRGKKLIDHTETGLDGIRRYCGRYRLLHWEPALEAAAAWREVQKPKRIAGKQVDMIIVDDPPPGYQPMTASQIDEVMRTRNISTYHPVERGAPIVDYVQSECKRCKDSFFARGSTDLWCFICTLARDEIEKGPGIAKQHRYVTQPSTYREPIVTVDIDWDP